MNWVPERKTGVVWEIGLEKNETQTKFLIKAQCLILKSEFEGRSPSPTLPGSGQENKLSCSAGSGFLQEAGDVAGQ